MKQKPKIVVNEETKKRLDSLGKKGDTYDFIIRKLLNNIKNGLTGGIK